MCVIFADLYDWSLKGKTGNNLNGGRKKASHKSQEVAACGTLQTINDTEVALFRHGTDIYAISEKCPHQGEHFNCCFNTKSNNTESVGETA